MNHRRLNRRHRSHSRGKAGGLNLTALMDIFTILVFFLMVNQSEVSVQSSDDITLPASIAQNQPQEQVTILITAEDILVQGRKVMGINEAQAEASDKLQALTTELDYLASRSPLSDGQDSRAITIMADKHLPYQLLKKVMHTCAQASFGQISLAVDQIQSHTGGGNAL